MCESDNLMEILWMLISEDTITAKVIVEHLEMNIRSIYHYIETFSSSCVLIVAESNYDGVYILLNDLINASLFFDLKKQTAIHSPIVLLSVVSS